MTDSSLPARAIRKDSARARRRERRKQERLLKSMAETNNNNKTAHVVAAHVVSDPVSAAPVTPTKPRRTPNNNNKRNQSKRAIRRTSSCSCSSLHSEATSATDTLSSCSSISSSLSFSKGPQHKNFSSPKHHTKSYRKNNNKQTRDTPRKLTVEVEDISEEEKARYLAIDCEMVGVGIHGHQSALARVSIVNWDGDVVMDTFVKVEEEVTDYRTYVSGITAADLDNDSALSFDQCRSLVLDTLKDKIVVGHGLKNDFDVLQIRHEWHMVRDTARYEPFMKPHPYEEGLLVPKKLKALAHDKLGLDIQADGKEHDSIEDAGAAMELYIKHRRKWEKAVQWKVEKTNKIILAAAQQ